MRSIGSDHKTIWVCTSSWSVLPHPPRIVGANNFQPPPRHVPFSRNDLRSDDGGWEMEAIRKIIKLLPDSFGYSIVRQPTCFDFQII